MKNYVIGGGLLIVLGLILLLQSKLWGALVLVAGLGVIFFGYSGMMRISGKNPEQATINGIAGQGKQQSEAVKENLPVIGEQSADIWDQLENKK